MASFGKNFYLNVTNVDLTFVEPPFATCIFCQEPLHRSDEWMIQYDKFGGQDYAHHDCIEYEALRKRLQWQPK